MILGSVLLDVLMFFCLVAFKKGLDATTKSTGAN
jgi:hypothetical protein